jgi:hypothetical protein
VFYVLLQRRADAAAERSRLGGVKVTHE